MIQYFLLTKIVQCTEIFEFSFIIDHYPQWLQFTRYVLVTYHHNTTRLKVIIKIVIKNKLKKRSLVCCGSPKFKHFSKCVIL